MTIKLQQRLAATKAAECRCYKKCSYDPS